MAINRSAHVRYGTHSSVNDVSATPGTLYDLRPIGAPLLTDAGYEPIARDYQTVNNEEIPALRGLQRTSLPDLSFPFDGLSGSGAGDGVSTSTLDQVLTDFIAAIWGQVEDDGAGDITGGTPGSGTTITMDGATSGALVGNALAFTTSSGAISQPREIVSQSGSTYVIDRDFTTLAGAADDPTASVVAYGSRTFRPNNLTSNPTHFYLQAEYEESARKFFGCMSNFKLSFPRNGTATFTLTGLRCTSWLDIAEPGGSYSAPTTGSPIIPGTRTLVWIGSTLYQAFDIELDSGVTFQEREHQGSISENGFHGFTRSRIKPMIRGKIREGTLTGPAEATDALLSTWRAGSAANAAATFDVGIQAGISVGSLCYIRAPALRFTKLDRIDVNGIPCFDFEAECTESGNHSNVPGSCRIHLF